MAQAYRHQGLGSTKQVVYYVRARIKELTDLVDRSDAERTMLQLLAARQDLPPSFKSHAHKRADKLSERIRTDDSERDMWQELLEALPLCAACKGYGETRYQDYDDTMRSRDCGACGGTGEGSGSASAPPL